MKSLVFRRYLLMFFAVCINAFGIVFIIKAALGSSPISTVPYVMSLVTPLSFGGYTFILNIAFILIEMALMGKERVRARKYDLMCQIPIVVVFSSFTDISMYLLRNFNPTTYWEMVVSLVVGCVILAIGIGWAVKANVSMNPGEYLVNVISKRFNHVFGNVKLCFDTTCVIVAIILSLTLLHAIEGIREGTIISALLVGPLERLFTPVWNIFNRFLS
ncbi:MAG: DUF6198 family protein [Porphyromonadaceae bacterium]|nr:DUF6198 family protein [Porphyromonadaceae bacterium]